MHILSILFFPDSAKADVELSEKLNDHLMCSCDNNMCTKND